MEHNIVVLAFEEEEPINVDYAFSSPSKAENMLDNVLEWQEKGLYELVDAVIAVRGTGGDLKIKQTKTVTGKYTLRGSGVGLLAGVLLGGPIGGLVAGTAVGAIAGKMKDIGIEDKFIQDISQGLAPNTSALFLMGKALDREKMMAEIQPFKAFVAITSLPEDQEKNLRKLLEREE
jgi:uncharacterized membrane protein